MNITTRTTRIVCSKGLSAALTLSAGSTTTTCQFTPGTVAVATNEACPLRRSGARERTGAPEIAAATVGSALRSFSDCPSGSRACVISRPFRSTR